MNKKYTIESLIRKTCGHGSLGYLTPEVIEAIIPYTGEPLHGFVNQKVWQINFESGKFTYMADFAFQTFLEEGWVNFWRTAGFSAMEVIEVLA
jgi:hypothetical protein